MAVNRSAYRGCLLGLAVGDAMGYTVDERYWQEIQRDYGPNGLLGYDLVNGYADVTSYTQYFIRDENGNNQNVSLEDMIAYIKNG